MQAGMKRTLAKVGSAISGALLVAVSTVGSLFGFNLQTPVFSQIGLSLGVLFGIVSLAIAYGLHTNKI